MERWVVVLLMALAGLGMGLALAGRRRKEIPAGSGPGEEAMPWRAVSPQAVAGVLAAASLLALAMLAVAGPILAAAAAILLFEVAVGVYFNRMAQRNPLHIAGVFVFQAE